MKNRSSRSAAHAPLRLSRGEALLLASSVLLIAVNFALLAQEGLFLRPGPSGEGLVPPNDSLLLAGVSVLVAVSAVVAFVILKYQKSNEWVEESFF